jgi:hypothetical protein
VIDLPQLLTGGSSGHVGHHGSVTKSNRSVDPTGLVTLLPATWRQRLVESGAIDLGPAGTSYWVQSNHKTIIKLMVVAPPRNSHWKTLVSTSVAAISGELARIACRRCEEGLVGSGDVQAHPGGEDVVDGGNGGRRWANRPRLRRSPAKGNESIRLTDGSPSRFLLSGWSTTSGASPRPLHRATGGESHLCAKEGGIGGLKLLWIWLNKCGINVLFNLSSTKPI